MESRIAPQQKRLQNLKRHPKLSIQPQNARRQQDRDQRPQLSLSTMAHRGRGGNAGRSSETEGDEGRGHGQTHASGDVRSAVTRAQKQRQVVVEHKSRAAMDSNHKKLLEDFRASVTEEQFEKALYTAHLLFRHVFGRDTAAMQARALSGDTKVHEKLDNIAAALHRLETNTKETTEHTKTWAEVARKAARTSTPAAVTQTTVGGAYSIPKKAMRELIVSPGEGSPLAEQRIPDIVAQVNGKTSEVGGAVAARKLAKSGDIIITFEEQQWGWYNDEKNESWVKDAFGPNAELRRKTYAVLAKGMDRNALTKYDLREGDLIRDLATHNNVKVARVRRREPRAGADSAPPSKTVQLLLEVHSVEEAILLVDRGLVIQCQIFPCERFEGEAKATQCYKCRKWGYKAKFCTNSLMCMICGNPAHTNDESVRAREAACPVRTRPQEFKPSCLNCGKQHPAFSLECTVAKEE